MQTCSRRDAYLKRKGGTGKTEAMLSVTASTEGPHYGKPQETTLSECSYRWETGRWMKSWYPLGLTGGSDVGGRQRGSLISQGRLH